MHRLSGEPFQLEVRSSLALSASAATATTTIIVGCRRTSKWNGKYFRKAIVGTFCPARILAHLHRVRWWASEHCKHQTKNDILRKVHTHTHILFRLRLLYAFAIAWEYILLIENSNSSDGKYSGGKVFFCAAHGRFSIHGRAATRWRGEVERKILSRL